MYYSECETLEIKALCGGQAVEFDIEKDACEPLGLNFETYLIDSQRSCKNKCIFLLYRPAAPRTSPLALL